MRADAAALRCRVPREEAGREETARKQIAPRHGKQGGEARRLRQPALGSGVETGVAAPRELCSHPRQSLTRSDEFETGEADALLVLQVEIKRRINAWRAAARRVAPPDLVCTRHRRENSCRHEPLLSVAPGMMTDRERIVALLSSVTGALRITSRSTVWHWGYVSRPTVAPSPTDKRSYSSARPSMYAFLPTLAPIRR